MGAERIIQGRRIGATDLRLIRRWLVERPEWNRTRLSRALCQRWDWRNGKGRLKDMACRSLLLKLDRMGLIELPPREGPDTNAYRNRQIRQEAHDRSPIESDLASLRPLLIQPLSQEDAQTSLFKCLLQRYHYLGYLNGAGENIKYLVRDSQGRVLACLLFGSAAWKTKDRDRFIGWSPTQRQRNLGLVANNKRLMILPWVKVPHLASHLLARVAGLLPADWQEKYGQPIYLLETFVERQRFRASSYRAAGWTHVGTTTGRSRNDVHARLEVPVKDIYLYPLGRDFRRRLCA